MTVSTLRVGVCGGASRRATRKPLASPDADTEAISRGFRAGRHGCVNTFLGRMIPKSGSRFSEEIMRRKNIGGRLSRLPMVGYEAPPYAGVHILGQ
jgi:hypothetical protein